jgi:hypothetical protein
MANFKIDWIDSYREPRQKPNPLFPNGQDLDASAGAQATCSTALPYPAKRCGQFIVHCRTCDQRIVVTTAGRPDDPRSLKIACVRPGIVQ